MKQENNNLYKLIKTKEIIQILDGDKEFGSIETEEGKHIKVAMPYLSAPNICSISNLFGLPSEYTWGGENLSRWQYFDNLMDYCISNGRCSDLIAYLFDKKQFNEILSSCTVGEIEEGYKKIVDKIIDEINSLLCFGGHELVIIRGKYIVRKIDSKVEIEVPKIQMIDREYIRDISERALCDVEDGNYDSAITKSRTLLEEVFCYVIEKKKEVPSTSGKIDVLYKQVKDLYNMHADKDTDRRINKLISGLEKIVSAISEMRNKDSDAHGIGSKRIKIDDYHARLFVNSAMTMADFILAVEKKSNH